VKISTCVVISPIVSLFLISYTCAQAETILTSVMEAKAGSDSNPLKSSIGDEQSFLVLSPSLSSDSFISESIDIGTHFTYAGTEYFGSEQFTTRSIAGSVTIHGAHLGTEGYITIRTQQNDNEALPEDESSISAVILTGVHRDFGGRNYSLSGLMEHARYPNITEENSEALIQNRVTLKPGIGTPLGNSLYLYGDLVFEWTNTNSSTDEYSGYAASAGLDYSPSSPFRTGISVRFGFRDYHRIDDLDFETDPISSFGSIDMWYTYRLTTASDLLIRIHGGTFQSEIDMSSFTRWSIHAGFRFTYEFLLNT